MKRFLLSIAMICFFVFSVAVAKERGILGVKAMPLTAEVKTKYALKSDKGLVIDEVLPDTPAQKAGFKAGDIILTIDKQEIGDPQNFMKIMSAHSAGDKVQFLLVRKGKNITKNVTLAPMPQQPQG